MSLPSITTYYYIAHYFVLLPYYFWITSPLLHGPLALLHITFCFFIQPWPHHYYILLWCVITSWCELPRIASITTHYFPVQLADNRSSSFPGSSLNLQYRTGSISMVTTSNIESPQNWGNQNWRSKDFKHLISSCHIAPDIEGRFPSSTYDIKGCTFDILI